MLRNSVSDLQLTGKAPSATHKTLATLIFFPLYGCFVLFMWTYSKLYGPLRTGVVQVCGSRFSCVLPDLIQRYIYLFGIWEPTITDFVSRRLDIGDTFVDVGAHAGYYTLMGSRIVGNSGRVIAIEASPRNFAMLESNLVLNNNPSNVRAINIAVANTHSFIDVFSSPESNLGMTSTYKRKGFEWEAKVRGATLDAILTHEGIRNARLIKIDVEGRERDILTRVEALLEVCHEDTEILVELSPNWWPDRDRTLPKILVALRKARFNPYILKNNHKVWQYLWGSQQCSIAKRVNFEELGSTLTRQVDLVFSRQDSYEL